MMNNAAAMSADTGMLAQRVSANEAHLRSIQATQDRHEHAFERIEKKIDSLRTWIAGLLVSTLGACGMLLANIVLHQIGLK
jgi:hypothetical protein